MDSVNDLLWTTKTCTMKPLKLQKAFCSGAPMGRSERFMAADERKLIAIQKSLMARPLY